MEDAASTPATAPVLFVFPLTPSLTLRGHGAVGAATTHPVFQAVSDRRFQVAAGGHSSGSTFLAGLILRGMHQHVQQPVVVMCAGLARGTAGPALAWPSLGPARGTAGPALAWPGPGPAPLAPAQAHSSSKPCPVCCCQRPF